MLNVLSLHFPNSVNFPQTGASVGQSSNGVVNHRAVKSEETLNPGV